MSIFRGVTLGRGCFYLNVLVNFIMVPQPRRLRKLLDQCHSSSDQNLFLLDCIGDEILPRYLGIISKTNTRILINQPGFDGLSCQDFDHCLFGSIPRSDGIRHFFPSLFFGLCPRRQAALIEMAGNARGLSWKKLIESTAVMILPFWLSKIACKMAGISTILHIDLSTDLYYLLLSHNGRKYGPVTHDGQMASVWLIVETLSRPGLQGPKD